MPAGGIVAMLLAVVPLTGCPINQPVVATGTIHVDAEFDNSPWEGPADFVVTGQTPGTAVPATYAGVAAGDYALIFTSGGPPDTAFVGSTPSGPQTVTAGGTVTFTLSFRTREVARSDVLVTATLIQAEGSVSWMGPVTFTLTGGLDTISGSSVPDEYKGMPPGTYTLTYVSGGPPGTTLLRITPSPTQTLSAGDTVTFAMEFG